MSDPKYFVGSAYRNKGDVTHWYLIADYNESEGLYSIERTSGFTVPRVEQSSLDAGDPVEVDWETGLTVSEMRVKDLKLGTRFYLPEGIQVWEVVSLQPTKHDARKIMQRHKTKVKATTADGGYTIKHTFELSRSDILHKSKRV